MTYENNNTKSSKPKKSKKVVDINIHKYDFNEYEKEKIPFTLICDTVIDGCTNYTAGWIWMYLLRRPADWVPCKWEIMKHFNISEPTYKRHMQYLKSCGLVELRQSRNDDGTLGNIRIIVLSGAKFNPAGDTYQGIIFDVSNDPVDNSSNENDDDRGIKNDPPVDPAPEAASNRGIKNDPTDSNRWIKKPVTGEMNPHTKERSSSTKEISHTNAREEFFLEKTLYSDSEQQRKAIAFRDMCLVDEKAIKLHAELKSDKTFVETLDECISHYATQQVPQLVSPQRLQSWIKREARFAKTESFKQLKYPTKDERAANEQKIRERELKAQEDKRREISASKSFKSLVGQFQKANSFAEAQKQDEEEMKRLGLTASEYHAHKLKKIREAETLIHENTE